MNNLMMFIWVIGFMYTVGNVRIAHREDLTIVDRFMLMLLWPIILGDLNSKGDKK